MGEELLRLGVALGLGLLVGLQREVVKEEAAGIRTFALTTLLGALASFFAPWGIAAGLVALASMLIAGNLARLVAGEVDPGLTTEVAALVMFLVGATVGSGRIVVGMAIGATVAVLLHAKASLHGLAGRLDERDVRAILQLVVIALVVLPLLPDRGLGPYAVLNPHEIWLMVVLIVGIGLGGYVAFRVLGSRGGAVANGLLGGLVSSTATTLSAGRFARETPAAAPAAGLVVVLASAVVYGRLLAEVAVVAPGFFATAATRLVPMLVVTAVAAFVLARRLDRGDNPKPTPANPAELQSALVFAALYALILLLVAWVEDRFGARALYLVAIGSGLTDMDAITLSTSRLVAGSRLDPDVGWRMILLASMANLGFKGVIAVVAGGRALARTVIPTFVALLSAGLLILALG